MHKYFTYFEGYDEKDEVVYNGNGYMETSLEADWQAIKQHMEYQCKYVKDKGVVRIVIKNITKL